MEYYEKFLAVAKEFGLTGKEMKEFVEEKVKDAEEKEKQKQINERADRVARRELEQLRNDNLKLQIDLQSKGYDPSNDSKEKSTPKDIIKIRKYDSKKEKIDVYLDYFESVMTMKKYEEKDWPAQLMIHLTGEAFEAYNSMDKKDKDQYQNIKKTLLCHFGKSENDYRREFHEIRIKMDKDPQFTVHEAHVKLTKWLELTSIDTRDPKAIIDMVLVDKFLENATPALFTYLTDKKIRTQAELTNALRTFKDSHPNVEMDKRHDIVAAVKNKKPEKRQEMRYQSLPTPGSRQTICWYCNKKGHIARHCYYNRGPPDRSSPNNSPIRKKSDERSRHGNFERRGRRSWRGRYNYDSQNRDYDQPWRRKERQDMKDNEKTKQEELRSGDTVETIDSTESSNSTQFTSIIGNVCVSAIPDVQQL